MAQVVDAFGPWPGTTTTQPPTGGGIATGNPPSIDTIPWLDEAPNLYDQMTLAGVILPGLVQFTGELGRKLDVKNAKGSDGATITDDGADPESIELSILLYRAEDWVAYQSILPTINPNASKGKLKPVDIDHPILALHGVKRIYIEKLSLPSKGKIPQTLEVRVKARGWRPEPPPATKSKTSTPDSTDGEKKPHYALGDKSDDGDSSKAQPMTTGVGAAAQNWADSWAKSHSGP